jgi:hypothetical protein
MSVLLRHQSASLIQQTKTRVVAAQLEADRGLVQTVSGYSLSKVGTAVFNELLERAIEAAQNPKCLVILVADECHWGASLGGVGGDTEAANNAVCCCSSERERADFEVDARCRGGHACLCCLR